MIRLAQINKPYIELRFTLFYTIYERGKEIVKDIIIKNEEIIASFESMRDKLIFTDKRIISVNVQGLTGKKIDYTSIPYSKIQAYSVETAGMMDMDAEIDITISGLGTVRFELTGTTDIKEICREISEKILE